MELMRSEELQDGAVQQKREKEDQGMIKGVGETHVGTQNWGRHGEKQRRKPR